MGFWSGLGKGLLGVGGALAAPFTGGASLIPSILGGVGAVASGVASGRAAGRAEDQRANTIQDQNALDFARLNLMAPQVRAQNSVRGDLLAGLQDVQLSRPRGGAGVQGGVRPSLLSPTSRQLGTEMSRQALLAQMQGPLSPTPQPQAGAFDKILSGIGYAGLIGQGIGATQDAMRARRSPPPTTRPPQVGPLSDNVTLPTFKPQMMDPRLFDPNAARLFGGGQ